jgi:hypothetical protein
MKFLFESASRNMHRSGRAIQAETRSVGGRDVKIHGLCRVKNEADVLQETLTSAPPLV